MNRNKAIISVVLLLLGVFFFVSTCLNTGRKSKVKNLPPGTHGVSITEVIQTSNYTYLQVVENNKKFWIAVVRCEAKPGDSVYYTKSGEMKDFVSKELGRTFPSIFFVEDPSDKLIVADNSTQKVMPGSKREIIRKAGILIETPNGAITIADLYKNRGTYAGKTVMIRGEIVKFNSQIMKKNWIHIQDGTDYSGKFDLAITTNDSLVVGMTATFKGIIELNKDFGYGYTYDVLMEQAEVNDKKY